MIYIACPYSHDDGTIRQERYQACLEYAKRLIEAGRPCFSPIAHSHPIAELGVDGSWQTWRVMDLKIMAVCSEVHVLRLDGWSRSVGVQHEINHANAIGIDVKYF